MEKNYSKFIPVKLAIVSGLLLALAYPGFSSYLGFLSLISFVPVLFFVFNKHSLKQGFLTGLLLGFVYFIFVYRWEIGLYPLKNLGIENFFLACLVIGVFWILSALTASLFYGLFFVLTRWFNNFQTKIYFWNGLVFAGLFSLITYLQSYAFGLIWWGSGSKFGPYWTMGNPAYDLVSSGIIRYLAGFIGIYGIVFIIFFINFLFFKSLRFYNWRKTTIIVAMVAIIISLPAPKPKEGTHINISLIQTRQPTVAYQSISDKRQELLQQLDLLDKTAKENPQSQMVVFPESTSLFKDLATIVSTGQAEKYFDNLFPNGQLIISGGAAVDDKSAYSRVYALDSHDGIIAYHDKQILAPNAEFISYFFSAFLPKKILDAFSDARKAIAYSPGEQNLATMHWNNLYFAPIVCSEIVSPQYIHDATAGSQVLVGMISSGLFHGNEALQTQNLAMARFRATENQKSLVVAANYGYSYAIDSVGNIITKSLSEDPQILTTDVVLDTQKSWYSKYGDLPILSVAVLLIGITFVFQIKKRKNT